MLRELGDSERESVKASEHWTTSFPSNAKLAELGEGVRSFNPLRHCQDENKSLSRVLFLSPG